MLRNLTIGLPIMLLCLALQAAVSFWSVRFYVQQAKLMHASHGLFSHPRPLLIVMIAMTLGNFVQIMIWGTRCLFGWASSASCMRLSTMQQ